MKHFEELKLSGDPTILEYVNLRYFWVCNSNNYLMYLFHRVSFSQFMSHTYETQVVNGLLHVTNASYNPSCSSSSYSHVFKLYVLFSNLNMWVKLKSGVGMILIVKLEEFS